MCFRPFWTTVGFCSTKASAQQAIPDLRTTSLLVLVFSGDFIVNIKDRILPTLSSKACLDLYSVYCPFLIFTFSRYCYPRKNISLDYDFCTSLCCFYPNSRCCKKVPNRQGRTVKETISDSHCAMCYYCIPAPIAPFSPWTCMFTSTNTFLTHNSFWTHTPPAQCPGPGSSRNNSRAAPPAATRWKLPLDLLSLSELCVCLHARGVCVLVCMCQQTRTCYPALYPITLHSRSILLHPATNMYVTSPSILSPLCCSVTTAPASASDCLWWLTVTQPAFFLVCPSRYKSLMILCVFCLYISVSILCVFVYTHTHTYTPLGMVSTIHIEDNFAKLNENKNSKIKVIFTIWKWTWVTLKAWKIQHWMGCF